MLNSALSIQKRIQQTYRIERYPLATWKGTTYGGKDQNVWNKIKSHGQHGTCQRLAKKHSRIKQSKVRGSKIIYELSVAIAQGDEVFPKTANKAVKTDVPSPFQIKY